MARDEPGTDRPANLEAERALLGSILHDPSILNEVKSHIVDPTFFGNDGHRSLWSYILGLQDNGGLISTGTASMFAGAARQRDMAKYVRQCVKTAMDTSVYWDEFAHEVAKLYRCRCIAKDASAVLEAAKQGKLVEAFEGSQNLLGYQHFPNGKLHSWAERETRPMDWLWKGWLAKGFATLIAAEKGEGKTWIALRIAKTLTTGCPWPDGTPYEGKRLKVCWLEAENFHDANQRRAIDMGIPLDMMVTSIGLDSQFNFENSQHVQSLFSTVGNPEIGLVILDSYSGSQTVMDENSAKAKRVAEILAALARQHQIACISTHHLNKMTIEQRKSQGNGFTTKERVRGSSAIIAQFRFVWGISHPDLGTEQRVLHMLASNFEPPEMLPFHLSGEGPVFGGSVSLEDGIIKTAMKEALDAVYPILLKGARESEGLRQELEMMGVSWHAFMELHRKAPHILMMHKSSIDKTVHWSLRSKQVADEL